MVCYKNIGPLNIFSLATFSVIFPLIKKNLSRWWEYLAGPRVKSCAFLTISILLSNFLLPELFKCCRLFSSFTGMLWNVLRKKNQIGLLQKCFLLQVCHFLIPSCSLSTPCCKSLGHSVQDTHSVSSLLWPFLGLLLCGSTGSRELPKTGSVPAECSIYFYISEVRRAFRSWDFYA